MKYLAILMLFLAGCATERKNYSCTFTENWNAPGIPEGVLPSNKQAYIVPSTSERQATLLLRTLDPNASNIKCEELDF